MELNNFSEEDADKILFDMLNNHNPSIKLDKKLFFDLLKNSLSLWFIEKKEVMDSIPTLLQIQFDKLIKVFINEREEFKSIFDNNVEEIEKIIQKISFEWIALWEYYFSENEKIKLNNIEQNKINDIKVSLGL